jgi:alpha-L-fucosidase
MSNTSNISILDGPFAPSMESLRTFQCPEWFRDAKLAFWSHWGPQAVPMYGDWYARHLYIEGTDQYRHHWRVYGHPSKVGYKDIVPLWKAENFDPEGLMQLFVDAGAKYFVAQAMHHDNFDNFDSAHNRWNSVNIGPRKDILALWKAAAQKHNLPFGVTEHLAASFSWWRFNKGADTTGPYAGVPYDGNNPEFEDFYYANRSELGRDVWLTDDPAFMRHWFDRIKDVIDKYQPDLLYSDSELPFGEFGMGIVAHLYNTSAALHGRNQAVYNQKNRNPEIYTVGVLDIERSQLNEIAEHPWQTDTSVGDWFYNVRDVYKTPSQVLETLVDIVSNNGNLVLNIPQKPDGTLDDECTFLLREMARWMQSGEAEGIFGSRPWHKSAEGPSKFTQASHFEEKQVSWTPDDFRFTTRGETLYAYQMKPAEDGTGIIRSLATGRAPKVTAVKSLQHGPIEFTQTSTGLNFKAPVSGVQVGPVGLAVNFG